MSVDTKSKLAVALHYDKTGAPRVVAKGKGVIGARIVELAREHDIPIEENEVLAGALSHVEIGDEIPPELYKAVAEVLVFVLRLSGGSADRIARADGLLAREHESIPLSYAFPRCHRTSRPSSTSSDTNRDQSPPCARPACRRDSLPARSFANVSYQRSEFRDDLAKRFFDLGTTGTFVAYKVDDYLIIASDKVRSGEGKLPASTFKIPNSIIALETGVVEDPDKDVFKWDGVTRSIEAWNKDHTLRSAIAVSAVPVYQEIARRIGAERMQKYVDLFDYGNRDIGGGIDQFWLTGNLRIDPDPADRFRRPAAPRRAAGVQAQPGIDARYPRR